jgi:hypothetical protein
LPRNISEKTPPDEYFPSDTVLAVTDIENLVSCWAIRTELVRFYSIKTDAISRI